MGANELCVNIEEHLEVLVGQFDVVGDDVIVKQLLLGRRLFGGGPTGGGFWQAVWGGRFKALASSEAGWPSAGRRGAWLTAGEGVWALAAVERWFLLLLFPGWRCPFVSSSSSASVLVWSLLELDFCGGNHIVSAGDFCFSAHLNAQRREYLSLFTTREYVKSQWSDLLGSTFAARWLLIAITAL